jgi:hypothetical protein
MLIVSSNNEIAEQRKRIAGIKNGFEKAMKRASARVAMQGRTSVGREIRQEIKIKAGDLNKFLEVKKYKTGAALRLRQHARISLRLFDAVHDEVGVSYQLSKRGPRRYVDDAFMGPKPGVLAGKLHGNVFKRVGKSRLPIKKLMGPSAWGVFLRRGMYKPTERDLMQKFNQRLRHEVDYLMAKGAARSG